MSEPTRDEETSGAPSPDAVAVKVAWGDVNELPVLAANQFVVQVGVQGPGGDEVILIVGHLAPPVIIGTPQEQRDALSKLGTLTVQPLARFSVSRSRIDELFDSLEKFKEMSERVIASSDSAVGTEAEKVEGA